MTSSARADSIGDFGIRLAENIGAFGIALGEKETTLRENSPITSAANHIGWERRPAGASDCAGSRPGRPRADGSPRLECASNPNYRWQGDKRVTRANSGPSATRFIQLAGRDAGARVHQAKGAREAEAA
jgi:hypothetical protein